ncbi:17790_t:CDS:2 [Dentiscutata erythropus]|uniref:17790_t:CDS:1 n=1 Tax=Dentiscutata erythropus TaxID=1348616 RepID=A0A9N9NZR4_9GLOM|nr:17790_t:CDS:2 [Dentiscutata erythropus]
MSEFYPLHEKLLYEWKLKLSKTENLFPCPTLNGLFKDEAEIFDNFMQNLLEVQDQDELVKSSQEVECEIDHDESAKSSSQEVECEIDPYLIQSLRAKLTIGKADEILSDFNILMRLPHAQLNKIFKDLDISQLDDVVLAILSNELVKYEDIAYQNYVVFFKYGLLEKVQHIKSKPSRNFLANISNIAKAKSKPMVYGLLLPLITEFDMSQPQLEVIARIIDSGLSEESIIALLNELFSDSYPSTSQIINSTSKDSFSLQIKWSSSTIDVLFLIFNQKFDLKEAASQHIIPKFLRHLDFNIELLPNDKKLGQLLMLLVTKHSKDFMENLEEIKVIAEKTVSMLFFIPQYFPIDSIVVIKNVPSPLFLASSVS